MWEISIKTALGKLRAPRSIIGEVERNGFEPLPISLHHAERAGALPDLHRDPIDRMLVAQAQMENRTLVARDRIFESYDVDVLNC